MEKELLVEYLKNKYNSLLINPEQLENEIGISEKQQSKLRLENNFPIPFKKIGKNVYYSIYSIASFILNEDCTYAKHDKPVLKQPKPKRITDSDDLSNLIILNRFITNIDKQIDLCSRVKILINYKILQQEIDN